MISGGQTIDLFKLQTELVDMKVDMAVSRTIDRVVDQISALRSDMNTQIHDLKDDMNTQIHDLKDDMNSQLHDLKDDMNGLKDGMNSQIHELRHEMRDGFVSLKTRVTAVETKLGMVSEPRKEIRSRIIDYCFRAGWLMLAATVSYLILPLHNIS